MKTDKNDYITELIAWNRLKMSEDKFWEIVEWVKWNKLSSADRRINFDQVAKNMVTICRMTSENISDFSHIMDMAFQNLVNFIGSMNPYFSGSRLRFLVYHIIGLGKSQYYNHLNNFPLIAKRVGEGSPIGYRECFYYCIPSIPTKENEKESSSKEENKEDSQSEFIVPVRLSVYAWHRLLSELEHSFRFVNMDTTTAQELYDEITKQLNNEK